MAERDAMRPQTLGVHPPTRAHVVLGARAFGVLLFGIGFQAWIYACWWFVEWVSDTGVFDHRTTGPAGLPYKLVMSPEIWENVWDWLRNPASVQVVAGGLGVALVLRTHWFVGRRNRHCRSEAVTHD